MPCMHLMLETFINIPYVSIHQHFYFHVVEWGIKFIAHCVLAKFFRWIFTFFLFLSFKINFSIIFDSIAYQYPSQSAYLLATKAVIKHYTIFIISTYFPIVIFNLTHIKWKFLLLLLLLLLFIGYGWKWKISFK